MKIKTAQCPRGLCLKSFISEAIRGVYFLRMRKREKISSSSLKVSNRERKQRRRQRQRKRHPKGEVALPQTSSLLLQLFSFVKYLRFSSGVES